MVSPEGRLYDYIPAGLRAEWGIWERGIFKEQNG